MIIMIYAKKLLTVFLLIFLLSSLVGCSDNKTGADNKKEELQSPPTLKVSYQDKSIQAVRGTYTWTTDNKDGTKKTINADTSGPTELVKNSTPLTVSPNSTITLNFSDKPEDITVNIWQENKPIKQIITDSKVTTPEFKDSVIYEVIATWDQGTVYYAFLVNVN
jgi:hypothetical protein